MQFCGSVTSSLNLLPQGVSREPGRQAFIPGLPFFYYGGTLDFANVFRLVFILFALTALMIGFAVGVAIGWAVL